MAICSFFMQGRCRYGERCWNEHPRGGRHEEQHRHQQQTPTGNRGSYNQRYVQPSNFSKSTTWTRDDNRATFSSSSDRDHRRGNFNSGPSYSQNRFSALTSQDHSRDMQSEKDGSLIDDIKNDLDVWDSSGQWMFSVYCPLKEKRNITGFTDISPEELRLECYTAQNNGNLQNYVNSVQQLHNQWKQRLHEIRNMNPSSQAALINDLTHPITAAAPMFGGQQSSGFSASNPSFGTAAPSAIGFSFKADSQNSSSNTGSLSGFPSAPGFGNKPTSGFGSAVTGSAASFSFAVTTASNTAAPGFGNTGTVSAASFSFAPTSSSSVGASAFSGFSSATAAPPASTPSTFASGFGESTTNSAFGGSGSAAPGFGGSGSAAPGFGGSGSAAPGFGSASGTGFGTFSSSTVDTGFGAKPTAVSDLFKAGAANPPSGSLFGQVSAVPVSQTPSTATGSASVDANDDPLFTPRSGLSAEELSQFESKKFTLTKIPRHPPPVDLLLV